MDTQSVKIIRRGSSVKDPEREQVVVLDSTNRLVQLLKLVLPVGGVRYVVPCGDLRSAEWLDGSLLEVRIAETSELITVYPKLSIIGLTKSLDKVDAGKILAAILHNELETQLSCIRRRVHDIFHDYVGLRCPEAKLSAISYSENDTPEARELKRRIFEQTGLNIAWTLDLEPEIMTWVHKLQAQLTKPVTKSFNAESRTAQFNLTFTSRIVAVDPAKHHIVQRRARSGESPALEMSNVLNYVHAILNPAFGIFGEEGLRIWQRTNFWSLLTQGFESYVAPRVAKEFGYQMEFSDFKRERTAAELETLELLENKDRLQKDFLEAEKFRDEVKAKYREVLRENNFNAEHRHVVGMLPAIKIADDEVERTQAKLESASRGAASQLSREDDGRAKLALKRFHDQLGLDCPDLLKLDSEGASQAEAPPSTTEGENPSDARS